MNEAVYSGKQLELFEKCNEPQTDNSPNTLYGRMCPELSAVTEEMILEPCSKKSDKVKFLFLQMGNGQMQDWLACRDVKLRGECLTLNIGECPNEESASSLSQILQSDVPEKYYLSARACQGILRRAKERGKELPEILKEVLERQAIA